MAANAAARPGGWWRLLLGLSVTLGLLISSVGCEVETEQHSQAQRIEQLQGENRVLQDRVQTLQKQYEAEHARVGRLKFARGHDVELQWNGNSTFYWSVLKVLEELRDRAPKRYEELLTYLPRFVYDAQRLRRENGPHAAARSDGLYAIDGGQDFEFFRFLVLHEVGHSVAGRRGDRSEAAADAYANTVLRELGYQYGYVQVGVRSQRVWLGR